ncbi:meiotically up-regulated gene 113-domain-containing protein [Corynascus similis CBS 632.67]
MPFFANTPEARIGRSDSKNPSTTCRGVTSSGRPCRRPITAEDAPAGNSRLRPANIRTDDPSDESLYCWQHKDQASASTQSSPGPRISNTPILEGRSSLDTLAERLGLGHTQSEKPQQGSGRPNGSGQQRPTQMARPKPRKEITFCCCFRISLGEVDPPPRPKPHPVQRPSVSTPPRPTSKLSHSYLASPSPSRPRPGSSAQSPGRHSRPGSEASQAGQFMSVIPHDATPQTVSQLLAELAKPISQQDEAGYIYIFWLTPESKPSTPPAEAARSLLAPPSTPRSRSRRPSDVLSSFARDLVEEYEEEDERGGKRKKQTTKKKILLKIGRANNVHRRLNEWQRQCGYNLSLVRYYPYVPSGAAPDCGTPDNPGPDGDPTVRKVPHSHKVERLVHIELAGRGLRVADREKCEACGREHREWFEVEATRSAVAEVDEVVRRWSDWDEGLR